MRLTAWLYQINVPSIPMYDCIQPNCNAITGYTTNDKMHTTYSTMNTVVQLHCEQHSGLFCRLNDSWVIYSRSIIKNSLEEICSVYDVEYCWTFIQLLQQPICDVLVCTIIDLLYINYVVLLSS